MLSRAEEKRVRALTRRRSREAEGLFLAEGVRVVEELLDAGIVLRLVIRSSSLEDTDRGAALARRLEAGDGGAAGVDARRVTPGELGRLADTEAAQGILVVAETPVRGLEDVEPSGASTVLVLDAVQDPGNLGTLARSAVAFGCDALICLPGTVDPWNPKAVRASAGALFRIPVLRAELEAAWGWLGAGGYTVLGADAGGEPVDGVPRSQRLALVVGNEGAGLSDPVRAVCERVVAVPMRGAAESLNAAVAGGILLYAITRERG